MTSKKYTILSIDDSKAVHAFVSRALESQPFEIVHALNTVEAEAILKAQGATIQLVLLDWEMPVTSGPEYLPVIKKLFPQLPVIMLTSKNDPSDIEKMLNSGASEYIMKPFTPDILIEKINSVLGI